MWPRTWHPETWICSIRGHVTPAAHARTVGPADAPLGAELADGRRLARCLRCDTWIEHARPTAADVDYETLPSIADLPKPRRGHPLNEAIVMRLIALNKASHALGFSILAIAALLLETNLGAVKSFAERLLSGVTGSLSDTGQYANQSWLSKELRKLLDLHAGTLKIILLIATLYAVVEWTEAYGLWRERRWAEYLTVIATAGFLPLEVHELLQRVTFLRVVALVVNLALLIWLVRNKRLFGVRGGLRAMHEDVDWAAILASPTPARRATARIARRPTVHGDDLDDEGIEAAAD